MDTEAGQAAAFRTASTDEVIDGLNDLLQLDHDAIGSYTIAIDKLENQDHAKQIRGFKMDHERHVRDLNELISELGGTPENDPHRTAPLKEGLQKLGGVAGDKGVLTAWRANELQVRTKYDDYASQANRWPDGAKRLVDRNALDEERHYRWVAETLQHMGVGSGESGETDLVSRARESATSVASSVSDRTRDLADTTRGRVAGGLESAAEKIDDLAARQDTESGIRGRAGDVGHRVAGGLESAAERLRGRGGSGDGRSPQERLEDHVREQPVQTLAALFGAGFIVGRILR